MFELLTDKLDRLFRRFAEKRILSEKEVDQFCDELRQVFLAGDVHLDVAKQILDRLKAKAADERKVRGVAPTEQLLSVLGRQLVDLLGGEARHADLSGHSSNVVMLVGLQGSGKTTTAAKLASFAVTREAKPLLVPLDWKRPAAVEQLLVLGKRAGVEVFPRRPDADSIESFVGAALEHASAKGLGPVILDTAGRLHVDAELMDELRRVKERSSPREILFVADGAVGQDAARQAKSFHEELALTGVILTKMDGDARGGAALSIKAVTGVPIVFLGTGESVDALEEFHPSRMASRILGTGDLETLFERVQEKISAEKEARLKDMLVTGRFNLDDFKEQIRQIGSFGPLESVLKLIPGVSRLVRPGQDFSKAEKDLKRTLAVIDSMTLRERADPRLLDGRRRRRIARGSGTRVEDVNRVLNQYEMFKKMFQQAAKLGPDALDPTNLMKSIGGRPGMRM